MTVVGSMSTGGSNTQQAQCLPSLAYSYSYSHPGYIKFDVFPRTCVPFTSTRHSLSFCFHASHHSVVFPRLLLLHLYLFLQQMSPHPLISTILFPRNPSSSSYYFHATFCLPILNISHPPHLWIAPGQSLGRAWAESRQALRSRHHHITKPPWPVCMGYSLC